MTRLLLMESGSFSTRGGGSAKDTYQLYRHLREKAGYSIDVFADFEPFEKGIEHIGLEKLLGSDYDIILMNSIRDAIVVERYVRLHGRSAKILYIDRVAAVTHYYSSPSRRLFSRVMRPAGDLAGVERHVNSITRATNAQMFKSIRDFGAKSYALSLLADMRSWLDCYVGINAEMASQAKRYFSGRTRIVYIPIAPHDQFVVRHERKSGAAIAVGRLEESQKKFSFLLKGLRRVLALHPELAGRELVRVCGTGPDSATYSAITARLGIRRNVRFMGYVPEDKLVRQYNASSFMVSTSEWEGLSHTFMEAMACGIPVLANSKNNSIISYRPVRRIVMEGRNGMVYRYGDVDDFAEKFYRLYSNPKLCAALGRRANIYVRRTFSRERMLAKYDSLLRSLGRSPPK